MIVTRELWPSRKEKDARLNLRLLLLFASSLCVNSSVCFAGAPYNEKVKSGEPVAASAALNGSIRIVDLKCESVAQPLSVQTMRPHLSWLLQPAQKSQRGLRQSAYRIIVSTSRQKLHGKVGDVWDTGKVNSGETTHIEYRGRPLRADTSYYWMVAVWDQDGKPSPWSATSEWLTGLLDSGDWKAKWIAATSDAPPHPPVDAATVPRKMPSAHQPAEPLPIFRHAFFLRAAVKKAIVRISGLGQYELRINGRAVNEDHLLPSWSNYRKKIYYNTFDVTELLRPGDNVAAILLGNGMYNVEETPQRYQKFDGSFGQPKLIFQASITFTDGTHLNVISDASWKQAGGPITFSSTFGGEDFDARGEHVGWDKIDFDDTNWRAALEVQGPGGELIGELSPVVRVMRDFQSVRVTEPRPGIRVYDLGQNFSGWPKIKVQGASGTMLKLIPGELLDEKGFVSQRSSGEPVWFTYVLRGTAQEIWNPRFSYYGFRYVQVEETSPSGAAVKNASALLSLEGQFVHSSAAKSGEFSSSGEQINRIHALIVAAIESNVQSVITDCPHREKLGWLEQTHLLGPTLMYNLDLSQLYKKIAGDMQDSQLANGLVPDIAPEYVQFEKGFRDSPEWGSAAILAPWTAYQHYGDARILSQNYQMMKRYGVYLESVAENGILMHGLGDWYDIGPGEPGESKLTSRGLTGTAIYYQDLVVLQKVADLLGNHAEAREYLRQANDVRVAFRNKFFNASTNQYDSGSQTANAMPLAIGLVPDSEKPAVLENLIADIRKHQNHVTAGDVGFHYVVTALSEGGRSDVLFDMISRNDSPSYGYQLKRGATTLTEAWDTNPESSQNHFMLGHIEEWFHRGLAGLSIDLSATAKEQIIVKPMPVGSVTWAKDAQDSVLGWVACAWKLQDGKFVLDVTIPVNTASLVYIPTKNPGLITESGRPVEGSAGVRRLATQARVGVFAVASGDYHFESPF